MHTCLLAEFAGRGVWWRCLLPKCVPYDVMHARLLCYTLFPSYDCAIYAGSSSGVYSTLADLPVRTVGVHRLTQSFQRVCCCLIVVLVECLLIAISITHVTPVSCLDCAHADERATQPAARNPSAEPTFDSAGNRHRPCHRIPCHSMPTSLPQCIY